MAFAGHLQQAGVDGRHAAEEAHLVALDELPEIADQAGVAIALRGGQQHFGADEERRQAGDHHAVDVEQRQAAEGGVGGAEVDRIGEDHGHRHFIAVAVRRQLRRAGGAAGVEVGRHVVGLDVAAALQVIARELGDQFVEVQHALRQRPALGLERAALRLGQVVGHVDDDHRVQLRQLAAQAVHLVPQVGAGEGRQGDQHLGGGGVHQFGDVLGVEQRVDGVDDAGRLAAPEGEVGVRQVRQQERHRAARAHAEAVEGVGGLGDLGEQLGVAQPPGCFLGIALQQEGQRRLVGVTFGAAPQQRVGAGRHVAVLQGEAFDRLGIAQRGDGGEGSLVHDRERPFFRVCSTQACHQPGADVAHLFGQHLVGHRVFLPGRRYALGD
ncbi:hypothetical protein D9M69_399340 [compost metagenome]